MSRGAPLIEIQAVSKLYAGPVPLRIDSLSVTADDRIVIEGLDATAAEMFSHLVSGAAVPDEGTVRVAGVDTRSISTDTEWLKSLDRFGLVSIRAVLLDSLSTAANLALPMTLAVDPMESSVRRSVEELAAAVDLAPAMLDAPLQALDGLGRLRVHLARALANRPELVLLEQPTRDLTVPNARAEFGRTLGAAAGRRRVGFVALSDDRDFSTKTGGRILRLDPVSGRLGRVRRWWFF
jgi:ABC-type transporter Mla maintaining outer membrane lipid asymmetry ATPase subunit MlaF